MGGCNWWLAVPMFLRPSMTPLQLPSHSELRRAHPSATGLANITLLVNSFTPIFRAVSRHKNDSNVVQLGTGMSGNVPTVRPFPKSNICEQNLDIDSTHIDQLNRFRCITSLKDWKASIFERVHEFPSGSKLRPRRSGS